MPSFSQVRSRNEWDAKTSALEAALTLGEVKDLDADQVYDTVREALDDVLGALESAATAVAMGHVRQTDWRMLRDVMEEIDASGRTDWAQRIAKAVGIEWES